jgi:hypothetical protein
VILKSKTDRIREVTMCNRTPDVIAHLPHLKRVEECSGASSLVVPIRLPFDYPLSSYDEDDEPWRVDASYPELGYYV